jgi:hypothetical protein
VVEVASLHNAKLLFGIEFAGGFTVNVKAYVFYRMVLILEAR